MNTSTNLWLLIINEFFLLALLLTGIDTWYKFIAFTISHGMCVLFTYQIILAFTITNNKLKHTLDKSILLLIIIISLIPLVGPAGIIMFIYILMLYPIKPIPHEKYDKIDLFSIESIPGSDELKTITHPQKFIIELIFNKLDINQQNYILNIINSLRWTPYKTRFLQLFLDYSTYPSIILEASRIINEKKDNILQKIEIYENSSNETSFQLATLYHEIYYLCLVDPMLGHFYLEKACRYCDLALESDPKNPDIIDCAIRYNLKFGNIKKAEKLLQTAYQKFGTELSFTLPSYENEIKIIKGETQIR